MSGLTIRDGRALPSLQITRSALAIIAEHCERRVVLQVRSVYLALLEAAGDDPWTQKALCDRAGVGGDILKRSLDALETLGLLSRALDGSWQLASPGSAAAEPVSLITARPEVPPELRERAERFFEFHAEKVKAIRGGRPQRNAQAIEAAAKILRGESESSEIRARLDYALGHRFYADKVLTLMDFARWWPKINAAYLAERSGGNGRAAISEPEWHSVSYEAERVQIS